MKNRNILITIFELCAISISLFFLYNINYYNKELYKFSEDRVKMIQAADRLRHSSDELTHFARTYAVTDNETYMKQYFKVLDIRNGKSPRPKYYEYIYWDLNEKDREKIHPDKEKKSLKELIQEYPFTKEELNKLSISEKNSNQLVELEVEAFNAMAGIFKDKDGKYTIKDKPDQKLAVKLLHSKEYYEAKEKIMKTIDEFMIMLNNRTFKQVEEAESYIEYNYKMFLLAIAVFVIGNILIYITLNKRDKKILEDMNLLLKKEEQLTTELKDINTNLENKIKEEVEKVKTMESKLYQSEKLTSMGEMIGNIAHHWRQPLSIISTGATGILLHKELNILNDEFLLKMCNEINKNAQYLSRTIDDFKNYIKNDSEKSVFNLSTEIKEFLKFISTTVNNNYIEVEYDLDESIEINSYKSEFRQSLINIYNNSKDVLAGLDISSRHMFISLKKENDYISLKILDSGGGIPENILPKIFEPYFTTKHQSLGTGLGLHLTYRSVVENMGGMIDIRNVNHVFNSVEYKCTEVNIILPLV